MPELSILVTGDMGFIGKHLMQALAGKPKAIGYDLQNNQDVRDKSKLGEVFNHFNPNVVIHLAALAGVRDSKQLAEQYISTNIWGTQVVADLCEEFGAKKLIFFSSSSVYGESKSLPVLEGDDKHPKSVYGITKLAGEMIVDNCGVPSVIIRPFTVYGEVGRQDSVIWRWIRQAKENKPITVYGDGSSCRGYVYVGDLVAAVVKLIDEEWTWRKQDFNLGGSEVIYLRDIMRLFQEWKTGITLDIIPHFPEDVYQEYTSTEKAARLLGFRPESRFVKNVKRILEGEFNG